MAKKPASGTKRSVVASSTKTGKVAKAVVRKKITYKPAPKKATSSAKAKSSKKTSYKQEYIKLLQKTNKTLTKDIKAIRKAIEQPKYSSDYEAFPKEEPFTKSVEEVGSGSIEEQILEKLQDVEIQIRSRDMQLNDLVEGSAKLGGLNG
jgi:hypothetical protein